MESIGVLLADDHGLVREGLALLLERTGRFDIVGMAADSEEVLELARHLEPRVVVLDVVMPGRDGAEVTRLLKALPSSPAVVVLSMYGQPHHVRRMIAAGADAYVSKEAMFAELAKAVEEVARGRRYFGRGIAPVRPDKGEPVAPSQRERTVLQLMAEGLGRTEIARRMEVSPRTVDTYRQRLRHKLEATSNPQLIRVALERGWL